MEPKEKAKELFKKYCYAIRTEETDSGYFSNVRYAKDCALICLNEILDYIQEKDNWYWQEVKQEIERL